MLGILNGDLPSSFESSLRLQSQEVIEAGAWYHIAVVHDTDKATKSIYVNGELMGIAAFGTAQSTGPFVLGAFKTEDRPFLYGSLDELFWTREVLSPEQIQAIMTNGISQSFSGAALVVPTQSQLSQSELFYPNSPTNLLQPNETKSLISLLFRPATN